MDKQILTDSAAAAAAKSLQSCPTLCDPINGSPPRSPVPGILQARTLEWAAISFSKRKLSTKELMLLNCGTGKTLESSLDSKEIKPVNSKRNQQ